MIIPRTDVASTFSTSKKSMHLLITIKSSCQNIERRNAIRETWGNSDWNRKHTKFDSKLVFLLAACESTELEESVRVEDKNYNDLVQWDFQDSFQNLTVKECLFLQFVKNNVSEVTHIFKGDDDVFVNPVAIGNLIDKQPDLDDVFMGSVLCSSPRITNMRSKYFVPVSLWPAELYKVGFLK